MPRIEDAILDCVVYVYGSVQQARDGASVGGSGFLVGIPSDVHQGVSYVYAVTNTHVLDAGGRVIRLNTTEGDFDVIETDRSGWTDHPDGDDVSVCPIELSAGMHKYLSVPVEKFLTREAVENYNIGPGDDVFMVGRFINHEGRQRNLPSVRFGNIAMMPWESIQHPSGRMQESFLVEARSIAGYSGAPVFVFPTRAGMVGGPVYQGLLGIDWGHIRRWQSVKDSGSHAPVEDWVVESDTGMMQVVPAWRLLDLLNEKELRQHRRNEDTRLTRETNHLRLDSSLNEP